MGRIPAVVHVQERGEHIQSLHIVAAATADQEAEGCTNIFCPHHLMWPFFDQFLVEIVPSSEETLYVKGIGHGDMIGRLWGSRKARGGGTSGSAHRIYSGGGSVRGV